MMLTKFCCRYMNGDEDDLPDWFQKDEKKFNSVPVIVDPVSGWESCQVFSPKMWQIEIG